MATITASAAGGNWNVTTAWVGGVVPTSADDVILDVTSGNITVTDNRTCRTFVATNYVAVFTINNGVTLSISNNIITLGAGMSFTAGTTGVLSNIIDGSIATTITFNGITIPNLTLGSNGFTAARTVNIVGTTPTVRNLVINNVAGNYYINFSSILNVTSSLAVPVGGIYGQAINLLGNVGVTGGVIGNIIIPTGSTLTMNSTVSISSISFTGGTLVHNNNLVRFVGSGTNNTSSVEWWDVLTRTSNYTFTSNLNVGRNYTDETSDFNSSPGVQIRIKGNGNFNIGGFTYSNYLSVISFAFIGTGVISMDNGYYSIGLRIIIDTTNPLGYVIGSATRLNFSTNGASLTLLNNSVASFFSTTSMTLGGFWTFDVNRTATGGSEIILPNIIQNSATITLLTETKCNNYSYNGINYELNGSKLLVLGNVSVSGYHYSLSSSSIEMIGNVNRTMSISDLRVNLIINKSGGATVTSLANMAVNAAKTLSFNTTTLFGTTLISTGAFAITLNNPSGSILYDLNTSGSVLTINNFINITRNLIISSTTTFAGNAGWACNNLSCTTAGSVITFQAGLTYTINNSLVVLGTAASRITFQSSSRATFNGTANGTVLTFTSGTTPSVGMTLSHTSGAIPAGFSNLLPVRPILTSFSSPNFVLSNEVSPTTGSISLTAGNKANLVLSAGASQNLAYITTQDIDSSGGQTIYAFESLNDTNLFRTINWNRLVAPNSNPIGYIFLT
jgi:hypothetical protein